MTCTCGSKRVISIIGKCSYLAYTTIPHLNVAHDGYIPNLRLAPGLGGDYIKLKICLDCGVVQNWTARSDHELTDMLIDAGIIKEEHE